MRSVRPLLLRRDNSFQCVICLRRNPARTMSSSRLDEEFDPAPHEGRGFLDLDR
jgi:hypothetical protein